MLGEEWEEAPIWFEHFYKCCDASEYARFQTCGFCHQCSRLCGRIQYLLKRDQPDEILANVPSILQDLDTTNDSQLISQTCSSQFYGRYCGGSLILQLVFRMRVLYHLLIFLRRASHFHLKNKKDIYKDIQTRCIQEMHALANQISRLFADQISLPFAHKKHTNLDHLTKSSATERVQSQMVRFEIDFDNLPDGNSTLIVNYHHSGAVITWLTFDCL